MPVAKFEVPLNDGKNHLHPFILPHLLLFRMQHLSCSLDPLKPTLNHQFFQDCTKAVAQQLGTDWQKDVSLALNGDGTPIGAKKKTHWKFSV